MRRVKYTYYFPVAAEDGSTSTSVEGDLASLLRAADPYLFITGCLPPCRIINHLLSSGISDLGMGGGAEWAPFAITDAEFTQFVEYLRSDDGRRMFHIDGPIAILDVPDEVTTVGAFRDWKIDEALKDPAHHLNSPQRNVRLEDGRKVSFREYWELEKRKRKGGIMP